MEVEHERERTLKVTQAELKSTLPVQNAHDIFNLNLKDFGPYSLDISRNAKHLLLAGKKGHMAMLEWRNKSLMSEFNVKDRIQCVKFL